jgi:hypothetical protein
MIVWMEEFMEDTPDILVNCSMEAEDCIAIQRLLASDMDIYYTSDNEALADFMVVRDAIDTDNNITIGNYNYEALAS